MRKYLKVFLSILILSSSVFALDNKYALELQRSKKLTQVIKRVNNIYDFINLYALQKGELPSVISDLRTEYANINTDGYLDTKSIEFSFSGNIITFTNVLPYETNDKTSKLIESLYKNHPDLHVNAQINDTNLSLSIILEPQTIKFLAYAQTIRDLEGVNTLISDANPCSDAALDGRLWYKPDLNGGFLIHVCESTDAKPLSNRINIYIYRNKFEDLEKIDAPIGTIAYAKLNVSSTEANEYVYDGTTWTKVIN